jgi:hypothetical protein
LTDTSASSILILEAKDPETKESHISLMNYPAAEQQGIRCHAGLDPASSLNTGFRLSPE